MKTPLCQSCGALMQTVRHNGKDVERCPWTKPGQPEPFCGRPFKRLAGRDHGYSAPPRIEW